jgi:enoyl-CoA hydratase/carnithine racemase
LAGPVEVSVDDFHVALVRLNRPEARNALSPEMREEIATSLERLDADPEVRCIVIAGADEFFAAGADIRAMAERPLDAVPDPKGMEFWTRLTAIGTPTIAAVSGYAFGGGCELALACDMIVCDEKTRFGQPEITLGIIPGGGGTQRLARAVGKQRAMEYVLTGRRWDARTAERWGLVNKVVGKGAWLTEAIELARLVAERPPLALRLAKQAVLAAQETSLAEGLRAERGLFEEAMATEDRVEGMNAFLEKREPRFKGR